MCVLYVVQQCNAPDIWQAYEVWSEFEVVERNKALGMKQKNGKFVEWEQYLCSAKEGFCRFDCIVDDLELHQTPISVSDSFWCHVIKSGNPLEIDSAVGVMNVQCGVEASNYAQARRRAHPGKFWKLLLWTAVWSWRMCMKLKIEPKDGVAIRSHLACGYLRDCSNKKGERRLVS